MTAKDDGTGDTYSDYPDESNIEFSKVYTQFIWYISTKIALILQARCVKEIFLILPSRDFIKLNPYPRPSPQSSLFLAAQTNKNSHIHQHLTLMLYLS